MRHEAIVEVNVRGNCERMGACRLRRDLRSKRRSCACARLRASVRTSNVARAALWFYLVLFQVQRAEFKQCAEAAAVFAVRVQLARRLRSSGSQMLLLAGSLGLAQKIASWTEVKLRLFLADREANVRT